ncbi:MAG: T9SS type A sorting domain-containing protein [Bacteroidota bacterium]
MGEASIAGCDYPRISVENESFNPSSAPDLSVQKIPLSIIPDLKIVPNPTSGQTNLSFTLTQTTSVSAKIFNSSGQLMDVLIPSQRMNAGQYEMQFNGRNQQAGLYYVVLQTDQETMAKRVLIVD